MPNKTRYLILPDRSYTFKLSTGEEIEISGLELTDIIEKDIENEEIKD